MQSCCARFVALVRSAFGGLCLATLMSACGGGGGSSTSDSTPTITAQPVNASVIAGQTASFSVSASGNAPLIYQWRKGGTNISGATGASYTTPAVAIGDNGATFSVVVSNGVGSTTSSEAVLTVTGGGDLTLLAGALGGPGYVDGSSNTRFDSPSSVAGDASGNVYVSSGQTIRKISANGVVSTLAGRRGEPGLNDGVSSTARFTNAQYLAVDASGNLFAFDTRSIRKVTPTGAVSTVATLAADPQYFPTGMTIDASGTLWLAGPCPSNPADLSVRCLVRVTAAGVVTSTALSVAAGVAAAPNSIGRLTVSTDGRLAYMLVGAEILTINTASATITKVLSVTPSNVARWNEGSLSDLCLDGSNNLWVSQSGSYVRFWRVAATGGAAMIVAGDSSALTVAPEPLNVDGPGTSARFFGSAISCNSATGRVLVADTGNHTIRAIGMGTGIVTTLAGTTYRTGAIDGAGVAARFTWPQQVVADSTGNWFILDAGNSAIRKVTPAGVVSVFAGSFGQTGTADGIGTAARFQSSNCTLATGQCSFQFSAIAIDASDNLYVADRGPNTIPAVGLGPHTRPPDAIRKITPAGVVTTLASGNTVSRNLGWDDFNSIAVDSTNGDIYYNAFDGIRRLRGNVSTPLSLVSSNMPSIAIDSVRRKLFVVSSGSGSQSLSIDRYSIIGETPVLEARLPWTTTGLRGAAVTYPGQVTVAANGAIFVTVATAHIILRVNPSFTRVDKVAGEIGVAGVELGALPARLTFPTGVAVNSAGQLGIVMGRQSNSWGEAALLVTSGFTP